MQNLFSDNFGLLWLQTTSKSTAAEAGEEGWLPPPKNSTVRFGPSGLAVPLAPLDKAFRSAPGSTSWQLAVLNMLRTSSVQFSFVAAI